MSGDKLATSVATMNARSTRCSEERYDRTKLRSGSRR